MNVDFGEGLRHGSGDSTTCLPICQDGFSRPFRPQNRVLFLSQGIGLRPQPWAGVSRPVGPVGRSTDRPEHLAATCSSALSPSHRNGGDKPLAKRPFGRAASPFGTRGRGPGEGVGCFRGRRGVLRRDDQPSQGNRGASLHDREEPGRLSSLWFPDVFL
jgi:hypothetical protein